MKNTGENLDDENLLSNLEDLLSQLNIEVRYEKGDFRGGICRVGDDKICLLNKSLTAPQKNILIAQSLVEEDLSDVFIVPAIRKFIESSGEQRRMEV